MEWLVRALEKEREREREKAGPWDRHIGRIGLLIWEYRDGNGKKVLVS